MFRRITVGLKGGMLPVASVAERLLKLGGCAPDCGLALPFFIGWPCAGLYENFDSLENVSPGAVCIFA